jgi:hypothetical protein
MDLSRVAGFGCFGPSARQLSVCNRNSGQSAVVLLKGLLRAPCNWLCVLCYFAVSAVADGAAFAVWRCLLLPDKQHKQEEPSGQQLLQQLRQLRRQPDSSNTAAAAGVRQAEQQQQQDAGGCIWVLLMLRGGHFAAAVVRVNSSSSSSGAGSRPVTPPAAAAGGDVAASSSSSSQQQQQQQQRSKAQQLSEPFTVLAHKTFHRYVVRWEYGVTDHCTIWCNSVLFNLFVNQQLIEVHAACQAMKCSAAGGLCNSRAAEYQTTDIHTPVPSEHSRIAACLPTGPRPEASSPPKTPPASLRAQQAAGCAATTKQRCNVTPQHS